MSKGLLVKIVILGDSGVGKSSILTQYVNQTFTQQYRATIGSNFLTKQVSIDDTTVSCQIWDTAGQERFAALGNAFYRGADCCILVFDVNIASSFTNIARWRKEFLIQASVPLENKFPFVVVGNKIDCPESDRTVSRKQAQSWCSDESNITYFEASAKENKNLDRIFDIVVQQAVSHHAEYSPPAGDSVDNRTLRVENLTPESRCSYC